MPSMNKIRCEGIPFWIPFDGVSLPKQAVKGGRDENQTLFIGRAAHCGSLTPGKVPEEEKVCHIPWGCNSNAKEDFEVLVGSNNYSWVAAEGGHVPINAFAAGHSEQGETLYIGRVKFEDTLIVGKIQPSHAVCYIAFEAKELNFKKYEVLVV